MLFALPPWLENHKARQACWKVLDDLALLISLPKKNRFYQNQETGRETKNIPHLVQKTADSAIDSGEKKCSMES
jgi:hypothetical protein